MESEFGFLLTQKAAEDLDGIIDYISNELSNPKAASDFLSMFLKIVGNTCSFPESGSEFKNEFLSEKDIRKKPIENYIMYYQPNYKDKKIIILRIVYTKRDLNEIISGIQKSAEDDGI